MPVDLLSSLPDDEILDNIKPNRITVEDSLIADPINIKEFADTVVMFDDIDVLTNKKIREEAYKIMIKAWKVEDIIE